MRLRDFLLLVLVCLVWAASNVIGKIVVGDWRVPPLYFVAVRFFIVAAVTLPWLLPIPKPWWRMVLIGLLMGGGNFALLFIGLQTASPSAAGIVLQIGLPVTILLSILVLGERIGWQRALGIALTFIGVMIVMWSPQGVATSAGLWFVAASASAGSVGGIMLKQMERIEPLRFQAWVAATSLLPLAAGSAIVETGQLQASFAAGWAFVAALLFSSLIVSVMAHTAFYRLIQQYEANLLTPLTLMTPLATIALGGLITGDRLDDRMMIGSALALTGVLIVAVRRGSRAPKNVAEHP